MAKFLADCIDELENVDLTDEEYEIYDEYIDKLIAKGKIIKHTQYDFTGEGLAIIINKYLVKINSQKRIIALQTDDPRIDMKVKGQGVYFLVSDNTGEDKIVILSFSSNCLTFWPKK